MSQSGPMPPTLHELAKLFYCLKTGDEKQAKSQIKVMPSLVNAKNSLLNDVTPLICAVQYPNNKLSNEFFQLLVNKSENLNAQDLNGFGAIHFLAAFDKAHLLESLLKNNAAQVDLNLRNIDGNTGLYIAAYKNASLALACLLKYKADPSIANNKGQTALHMACLRGNAKCVELLLLAGAKVNALDNASRTPLHYLAQSKADQQLKSKIFMMLIEHGSNTLQQSQNGKSACEMAEHFKAEDNFISTLKASKIPSLAFLCTQVIAKELKRTGTPTKYLNLPENLAVTTERNRKCL